MQTINSQAFRSFSGKALLVIVPFMLLFAACSGDDDLSGRTKYSYTVTLDGNGVEIDPDLATITVNSPATTVDDLLIPGARTGYVFYGWNTKPDGTGTVFTRTTPVTADITVYARWVGIPSIVRFFVDESAKPHDTKIVTFPDTLLTELPVEPLRAGYIFAGWVTDLTNEEPPVFDLTTPITADRAVYARWKSVNTVTFIGNGAIVQANPPTKTVISPETSVGELPSAPTRPGFGFAGWNTAANGSGAVFHASTAVTASMMVYAQWTASAYTVTFNKNNTDEGSTDASPLAKVVGHGGTVGTLLARPVRAGYAFTGWNTEPNGSGLAFTEASSQVTADVTVYAQWAATAYTVTYNKNTTSVGSIDASPTTKIVITPATTVGSLPGEPSRPDYVFAGWNTLANGSGAAFTENTPVTANTTVYAQWKKTYTVTFNATGSNENGTAYPQTRPVTWPATTVALPTPPPTMAGSVFNGWNTKANGSGSPLDENTPITANTAVYAQWTKDVYTVTFNSNGGDTAADPPSVVVVYNTRVSPLPAQPTRAGYTFSGWNTQQDGNGDTFNGSTYVKTNMTVFAKWAVKTYTVTFVQNGGSGASPTSINVIAPATTVVTLPTNEPSRTGYNFTGWNTDQNGNGTVFTANTPVTASIKVYAQWTTKSYLVNFDGNGATTQASPSSMNVSHNGKIDPLPAPPTKAGGVFTGWFSTSSASGGTAITTNTTVTADRTVYARWTTNKYTVTFNGNGATTEANPQTRGNVNHGDTVTLPVQPRRAGYAFTGWNTALNGSGSEFTAGTPVTADISVFAQWTALSGDYAFDGGDFTGPSGQQVQRSTAVSTYLAGTTGTFNQYGEGNGLGAGTGLLMTGTLSSTGADSQGVIWASEEKMNDPNGKRSLTFWVKGSVDNHALLIGFTSSNSTGTVSSTQPAIVLEGTLSGTSASPYAAPLRTAFTGPNLVATTGVTTQNSWVKVAVDINGYGDDITGKLFVIRGVRGTTPGTVYNFRIDEVCYEVGSAPSSYTVTFDSAGGNTVAPKSVMFPSTTVGTLPTPPTRAGYSFGGWYTLQNGGGTQFLASTAVTANTTVYAKWTANSYTVSFYGNGMTMSPNPTTRTVSHGASVGAGSMPNPLRTGYTLSGWNSNTDGSGTSFTGTTQVTAAISVYAQWTANTCTVTFNKNNTDSGSTQASPASMNVSYNTSAGSLPVPPTRSGYGFNGWFSTSNASGGTQFLANTTVTTNITVYARWASNSYTVTFDKNTADAGSTAAVPPSKSVSHGTTLGTLPTAPTRPGHTFLNWDTEPDGSGTPVTINTAVTTNITLYAQWAAKTYTVTFDGNGVTMPNPATRTVSHGASLGSELPDGPARTGYGFAGWYNTSNASGGTQFTASTTVTTNITVYARWTANSYTVTFNGNGATTQANPTTRPATAPTFKVASLPTDPSRTGYKFINWNTAQDGSGSQFTTGTAVAENMTVYAQWKQNYTVTFNSVGGSSVPSATVIYPATNVGGTLPTPAKAGSNFMGWNTAQNGSGTVFTAGTTVTGDITVYAQWATGAYTVTFNSNGGSTVLPGSASHGGTVSPWPANPTQPEYIFAGWNTALNGTGSAFTASTAVTANVTVYAQWDKNLTDSRVSLLSIAGKVTGGQNVRNMPSTSGSAILDTLLANTFVHIEKIDADSKWLVVEYQRGTTGYISFGSVTEAVVTSRVGKVLANKNVYATQATTTKVGVITANSFVVIPDGVKSGNWYKILYDGTQIGYIEAPQVLIPKGVTTTVTASPNVSVSNRASTNNPGKRNSVGKRGPDAYNQIINQFNVGQNTPNSTGGYSTTTYNARYNQTRSSTGAIEATYCNIFNWDVMTAMEVHFPHWALPNGAFLTPVSGRAQVQTPYIPPAGTTTGTANHYELSANMLYEWMRTYGKNYGWTEVDPSIAQNRANNGFPTVTVWRNNSDASSGHVQVVRPENGSYVYTTSANGAVAAQAGASNFNYGTVRSSYSSGIPPAAGQTWALRYYTHDIITVNGGSDAYNQPEGAFTIDPSDPGM